LEIRAVIDKGITHLDGQSSSYSPRCTLFDLYEC
jgi:hypothetical protein